MKDFFKYVGATVVGLIIFGIIATVIGIAKEGDRYVGITVGPAQLMDAFPGS